MREVSASWPCQKLLTPAGVSSQEAVSRETGCCYQLPRDECAKYLAYHTPWIICIQLYIQEGRGGGKEALDFCPGRGDKVQGEEEGFFTAPANSYLLPYEVLVQTLNVVQ